MRLLNILAAIIVFSVLSVQTMQTMQTNIFAKHVQNNVPPSHLDVMRQRYFSIEDAFWHAITGGLDVSQVLQQIHSGHRSFLSESFSERNCYFSTFDPNQKVLYEAIQRINQSATTTIENYLHSSRMRFSESDALAISARNYNLTDQFDKIFQITGTTDFYMTIRNVS